MWEKQEQLPSLDQPTCRIQKVPTETQQLHTFLYTVYGYKKQKFDIFLNSCPSFLFLHWAGFIYNTLHSLLGLHS